jgi:hypothetical protein
MWFAGQKFHPTCDVCILNAHIQDGGMHVAFDQNKSIYFENQARYEIIVEEIYISF